MLRVIVDFHFLIGLAFQEFCDIMSSRKGFVAIWTVILFFSLAQSSDVNVSKQGNETDPPKLFCRNPTGKLSSLPVTFPNQFSVVIEAVYNANDSSKSRLSDAVESIDQKTGLSTITRFEDGIGYQYIFNKTDKTYAFVNVDTATCTDRLPLPLQTTERPQDDPLLFPNNATAGWLTNITSILDVWAWVTINPKEIYLDESEASKHSHGLPIDHYFVCKKVGDYVIQVEICVTKSDQEMPFENVNGSLPILMDIRRFYNGTDNATRPEEYVGYSLSNYKVLDLGRDTETFLPPPGVPCASVSTKPSSPLPELPKTFSVQIDYLYEMDRKIAASQLNVDLNEHYLAFEYSDSDSGLQLEKTNMSQGKVVHDFHTGIEYVINTVSDTCLNVTDIPNDANDAHLDESAKQRLMEMKNASELLQVHLENYNSFYYVGERKLDNEIPADVWLFYKQLTVNTSGQPQNQTTVHEIYFSKPDWKQYNTIGISLKQTLLAVKKYDYQWLDVRKAKRRRRHFDSTISPLSRSPARR